MRKYAGDFEPKVEDDKCDIQDQLLYGDDGGEASFREATWADADDVKWWKKTMKIARIPRLARLCKNHLHDVVVVQ